ncbi:site-specific integrase [Puniceicoccaceae bacterium K14]|nr:site-specific integrase [Puniceicoccaceae bacterium K14]
MLDFVYATELDKVLHRGSEAQMFDDDGNLKYLDERERYAFFKAVECHLRGRKRLLCLVMFFTGCRVSESLGLSPSRLLPHRNMIVIMSLKKRGKTVYRYAAIPPELMADLMGYVDEQEIEPDERLFPVTRQTAWRWVKDVMKLIGITGKKACGRGLRHTFATAHAGKDGTEEIVGKLLGHDSKTSTKVYFKIPLEAEIRQAKKIWYGPHIRVWIIILKLKIRLSKTFG